MAPFFSAARYMIGPLFSTKNYMNDPIFLDSYMKGPIFSDILVYAHMFRLEVFRGCLFSWYYMNWLWYLSNNQQKNGYKISKGSIWIGQHFGWSSIWMGPFFSKARYMNGVGFEILARTPVPKLALSYTPPRPPPRPPPPPTPARLGLHCPARSTFTLYVLLFNYFIYFVFFLLPESAQMSLITKYSQRFLLYDEKKSIQTNYFLIAEKYNISVVLFSIETPNGVKNI